MTRPTSSVQSSKGVSSSPTIPTRKTSHQWYEQGRHFPGLIVWRQELYLKMTTKELLEAFEELAQQDAPFAPYPIVRIWPKR
jgi:hypothetical protein